jgi:hypothetical protein
MPAAEGVGEVSRKYGELDELMARARKGRRKLANNTYLEEREHGALAIRLHATDVLIYRPNGTVELNSGGWRTITTKDRLCRFLPGAWHVFQVGGAWYLSDGSCQWGYEDGMVIHDDGTVTGWLREEQLDGKQKLRQQVRDYAKAFIAAFDEGEVPVPSRGDCLFCLFEIGIGRGQRPEFDEEHLLEHLRESYFVPSLLAKVIRDNKEWLSQAALSHVNEVWAGTPKANQIWSRFGTCSDQLVKVLTRHLYRALNLGAG